MQPKENARPRCIKCNSGNIIVRQDRTWYCRRCGYDSKEDNK